tara:strand:+ start:141 stop:602 length:462 start_codon:yes stop_codon:yes gene_type:complete
MKKILLIIPILLILFSCQKKYSEKEEVESTLKSIFENFDNPNFESFKKISTERVYCKSCFENKNLTEEHYKIDREHFFKKFIQIIPELYIYKEGKKSTELKIVNENNNWSDITAYLIILKKGELEKNHKGERLGIYLKRENRQLKFTGIELIP